MILPFMASRLAAGMMYWLLVYQSNAYMYAGEKEYFFVPSYTVSVSCAHAPVTPQSRAMSNVAALALRLSAKAKDFVFFLVFILLLF
jgi:hypothetical protein